MVATYCSVQDVVNQLQMLTDDMDARFVPEEDQFPKESEITEWIEQTEYEIEKFTRRAWRTITTPEPEYHSNNGVALIPHGAGFRGSRGVYVKLKNTNLLTFSGGSGDKLECFDGDSWEDFAQTRVKGLAIGDGDYYVNEKKGEIWITTIVPLLGRDTIRVTYRYGNTGGTIPKDIKRACILLTCLTLLESDTYVRRFLNAQNEYSLPAKARSFEQRAYRILRRNRRYTSSTR